MFNFANADLFNISSEQVLDSTSHQEYRNELLKTLQSGNVCEIQLEFGAPHVITRKVAIEKLTLNMISVIYKMHRQLQKDRTFRHHIGGLLELDLKDIESDVVIATEVGGLGLYSDGTIELLPIPSGGRLELQADKNKLDFSVPVYKKNNNNYSLPAWAREEIPHIFGFHLHATDTSNSGDKHCAPSIGIDTAGFRGDIGYAVYLIKKQNFSHEFVLTKLQGRRFSVVYFGGEKLTDNPWFVSVVSLPNFDY
ncbi:hypothetical protein ACFL17_08795 [Pseudomonadota bacterium]